MPPPRDVMRETQDFEAMREALRRAIAGEDDPKPPKTPRPGRARRRGGRR